MMMKLSPSQQERARIGSWLLSQKNNPSLFFFYLLILFLPTQVGKHFWLQSSFVYGLRIDYLSPTLYLTDILILIILILFFLKRIKDGNIFKKINSKNAKLIAITAVILLAVSYTHLRAHETDSYLVCRLLLE